MGWRGPCATCRTSLASCPARPAKPTAPPGPVTRAIYRFPGSSHVPGVSPEWCPFPAVKAFLRPSPAAAQGVESYFLRVFSLSTERRRLSATKGGYPPYCSHVAHRTRIVGFSATKRPRGGGRGWAQAAGHNKTRPPPLMGWRGPRPACRTGLAGCPACPAATAGHQGQTPARITGFPALLTFRSFPRVVPVSGGESISTPEPSRSARGRELFTESFFVVHRTAAVIRNRMRLSTASFTGYPQIASCLPAAGTGARAPDDPAGNGRATVLRVRARPPQRRRPPQG